MSRSGSSGAAAAAYTETAPVEEVRLQRVQRAGREQRVEGEHRAPIHERSLWWSIALLLTTLAVYALYFFHLTADFPNQSPWQDWSKYTDEGWYANAAIRHFVWGHWFLPGDFNPAAALPVWPLLAAALFHFTGVSLVAVRAMAVGLFGLTLVLTYALMRRWTANASALAVVALAAVSPFLYSFERQAILEPLVVCLLAAAMLLADTAGRSRSRRGAYRSSAALGLVLATLVLTKTTTVSLFPAIVYLLWYPQRAMPRRLLQTLAVIAAVMAATGGGYALAIAGGHYGEDFRYLFQANVWAHPATLKLWFVAGFLSLKSLLWPDRVVAWLALAVVALSCVRPFRGLWKVALYPASLLTIVCTLLFVFWHNNQQPRYFVVTAIPYYVIVVLGVRSLVRWRKHAGWVAAVVVLVAGLVNLRQTASYVRHPEYTWVTAARNLTSYVDAHPESRRLLLSISGDDITLMTGLPAICDDFGTLDLPERIRQYPPGWFAAWNDVDPGTLQDIHTVGYRLVKVASFPALNDPDRNLLVLFRMAPGPGRDEGVVVDE